MKKIITCLVTISFVACVHGQQQPKQENATAPFPQASTYANTKLTLKIIDAPNHTYGYDVLADGRLVIHQKSIPATPATKGLRQKQMLPK